MTSRLRALATLWHNRTLAPEQLQALQVRKLRAVVDMARRDVPFYRDLYAGAGVPAGMPRTLDDVQRLPMVTKAQMRAAGPEALLSSRLAKQRRVTLHTSGTTGEPLSIPLAPADAQVRSLVDFRDLLVLGFRPWDTLVTVGPGYPRAAALHERLGVFRTIVIPGTLSLDEQVRRIRQVRPTILWCYPAILDALLHHPDRPLRGMRPRFLIASASELPESVRRLAETELTCKVFVSYACMEVGRIATQCPSHGDLHVNADHVLLELLNDGRPAPPGETGETVLTALNQQAMPFIRYRLGDNAEWSVDSCRCGSRLPLIRTLQGRQEFPLTFPGGLRESPTRLIQILRATDIIERYVIIQEAVDWIRVQVLPTRPWREGEREQLQRRLMEGIPSTVRLDIETVERFDQPPGKFRMMISKLPLP